MISYFQRAAKKCTSMANIARSNPKLYEVWKFSHKYNLNYTGSSLAMETADATKIFGRSVEKHGFYYTHFMRMVIAKPTQQSKKCTRMITKLSQNMNASVITKKEWTADFVN